MYLHKNEDARKASTNEEVDASDKDENDTDDPQDIITKNEMNKPLEDENEEQVVQNNEIDITTDAIKCDECTAIGKCVSCTMKHVYTNHDNTIEDTEQCLDESIETILKKARAFDMDESMNNIEDFV